MIIIICVNIFLSGITLEWDKGMRVYVKLDPIYQGKVCGLCGNFDTKADNDFRSRNDLIEDTALAFANSWKTSQSCPDLTEEPRDPCLLHPERKYWASYSCNVLKSPAFAPCHAVVSTFLYIRLRGDVKIRWQQLQPFANGCW